MKDVASTLKKILSPQQNDIIIDKDKEIGSDMELDINNDDNILNNINPESSSSSQSKQSTQSNLLVDSSNASTQTLDINNINVDKLITVIIKKHDEGYTFNQMKQFINQNISQL